MLNKGEDATVEVEVTSYGGDVNVTLREKYSSSGIKLETIRLKEGVIHGNCTFHIKSLLSSAQYTIEATIRNHAKEVMDITMNVTGAIIPFLFNCFSYFKCENLMQITVTAIHANRHKIANIRPKVHITDVLVNRSMIDNLVQV